MTARELLERAETIIGLELEPAPACKQPSGKLTGGALEVADWLESARAYLALPMTTLTDEEQKWADATMDNTKMWLVPSLRAAAGRLAELRSREGELVAALEDISELADYLPKDANVGGATFRLLDEIQAKARAAQGKKE